MRSIVTRWFLFGLLLGWSLTHATVFGQVATTPAGGVGGGAAPGGVPQVGAKGTPMSPAQLREGLDKKVTIDYTAQSLSDLLNHFRDRTGLNITVDQIAILQTGMNPDDNMGALQVKATNEKAGQALRRVLNTYRLCFIIIDDSILVTTEEMAVFRQMRQRVNVELENVPLQKAVRDLAKTHGINLVIDPKVNKQSETPVTLQLENAGIETTLRLIAELGSLKAVRMGNVVFITNEDKAKKIRDEEQHQFDNPLNPNMPVPLPVMRAGAFGGVALPAPGVAPALPPVQIDPAAPVPIAPDGAPARDLPLKKQIIEIGPNGAPVPPPIAPSSVDRPLPPPPPPAPPIKP